MKAGNLVVVLACCLLLFLALYLLSPSQQSLALDHQQPLSQQSHTQSQAHHQQPQTQPQAHQQPQTRTQPHQQPQQPHTLSKIQPQLQNSSEVRPRQPFVNPKTLPQEVIEGIKKVVIFIGYARSGHSIVGALLDAHPHIVVPYQYCIFTKFSELDKALHWRDNLYNVLYKEESSYRIHNVMSQESKGYSLEINGLWQGKYDRYIDVIGDKCGDRTSQSYMKDKARFRERYQKLKEAVKVPIRVIHVLRNPFDIISTASIMDHRGKKFLTDLKHSSDGKKDAVPASMVQKTINTLFKKFDANVEMMKEVFEEGEVLELHNSDLVADSRGILVKIFDFLEVDTTEHFLDVCEAKIFKSVSQSRNLMVWPPNEVEILEERMKGYTMLSRYSFTSD